MFDAANLAPLVCPPYDVISPDLRSALYDPILAHEHTLPGPKADRLALMNAVPANLSPIYALYRQTDGWVPAVLRETASGEPLADLVDDEGTRHTAWAIYDDAIHEQI